MVIQKGIHVCPIPATMTDNVRFLAQVSIVLVPLVGRAKDAKVCTKKLQANIEKESHFFKEIPWNLGKPSLDCLFDRRSKNTNGKKYRCACLFLNKPNPSVYAITLLQVKAVFRDQVDDRGQFQPITRQDLHNIIVSFCVLTV